jgi:hypothetical protein
VEGPLKCERWRVLDVPDEELHTFVNDLLRPVGTYALQSQFPLLILVEVRFVNNRCDVIGQCIVRQLELGDAVFVALM